MQLKKRQRKLFNKQVPCHFCGEGHATGTCPRNPKNIVPVLPFYSGAFGKTYTY